MNTNDILSLTWNLHPENPLIQPPYRTPLPVIADPTFIQPHQAPDEQWHLFAHSMHGIHRYTSPDGIAWQMADTVVPKVSMRPYIRKFDGFYYLFYEKVTSVFFPWQSYLEVRRSEDLITWSEPTTLLEPSLPWHIGLSGKGQAVGNPCVLQVDDGFMMFYSAGLVLLKDCRFNEPAYIGIARSKDILGPYTPDSDPILGPDPDDPYANLGAGAIKVLKIDDGYVGFQNGIYWDNAHSHSGSAIRRVFSTDGRTWSVHDHDPIIKPDQGWKKSHVYALDVQPVDDHWNLYFNARDGWLIGKERIGLAIGS